MYSSDVRVKRETQEAVGGAPKVNTNGTVKPWALLTFTETG